MGLTPFGFILLPLTLVFLLRPGGLMQLALLAAAFGAAVPFTFSLGGEPFGLPGAFLPALLFLAISGPRCLTRRHDTAEADALRAVLPLLAFAACAVGGAVLLPRLFAGQIEVWPQREDVFATTVPLAPNSGNITQSLYLVVDVAVLGVAALVVAWGAVRPGTLVRAYLLSGFLVVGISLWQFASKHSGLYFPDALFYSNPRWAILTEQAYGDLNRINGPFTEPAALAVYLAGVIFACLRLLLRGEGGSVVRLLLLLSLLVVLMSTSTTGIVVLAVFVPIVLLRAATVQERFRIALTLSTALGAALLLTVVAYVTLPAASRQIEAAATTVIEATLEKPESRSYSDRTTKDIDSLAVLAPSIGLGAGWGSVRSSSLVPGILGNTGIPGLLLLGWFALGVARRFAQAGRIASNGETRLAMEAMAASILGSLCAALLSAPSINDVDFFLRLAVAIGCAARIRAEGESAAGSPGIPSIGPSPVPAPSSTR